MEDTRTEKIVVYTTEKEKQEIRQAAAENGEQMSAYVRRKSLPNQKAEATA